MCCSGCTALSISSTAASVHSDTCSTLCCHQAFVSISSCMKGPRSSPQSGCRRRKRACRRTACDLSLAAGCQATCSHGFTSRTAAAAMAVGCGTSALRTSPSSSEIASMSTRGLPLYMLDLALASLCLPPVFSYVSSLRAQQGKSAWASPGCRQIEKIKISKLRLANRTRDCPDSASLSMVVLPGWPGAGNGHCHIPCSNRSCTSA